MLNYHQIVKKFSYHLFLCPYGYCPDCSGTNVKPILHKNYQGEDIILPDDPSIKISVSEFPELLQKQDKISSLPVV